MFVGAIAGVPDSSTGRQPTRADWLNGPHAPTLSAIEALALTTAGTSAAAQVSHRRLSIASYFSRSLYMAAALPGRLGRS